MYSTTNRLTQLSRSGLLALALAGCAHLRQDRAQGEGLKASPCSQLEARAAQVLATQPDSNSSMAQIHHVHAAAMAEHHACLAGHRAASEPPVTPIHP